jgi:hypothetical protein
MYGADLGAPELKKIVFFRNDFDNLLFFEFFLSSELCD